MLSSRRVESDGNGLGVLDVVAAGEEVAIDGHQLGLALVVQLLAQAVADLDDGLGLGRSSRPCA
jgi:hypothetical protein